MMNIDAITSVLEDFRKIVMPEPELAPAGRRPSAVLIPLMIDEGVLKVVLTERSSSLRHHAGQISFPGGRIDEGEVPHTAALREANEEIGLKPEDVELIGFLPGVITTANYHIVPILGLIKGTPTLTKQPDEVARILIEPLMPILDPANFMREPKQYNGVDYQTWVISHPNEYIWGATAKLIVQWAGLYRDQMGNDKEIA